MVSKLYKYRQAAFLFLVAAILLLSGLDKIDVNIMEARNFISAREMVEQKEYLLTTLNNEPRYQKPPLPTWLTAVSGSIFGFNSLFALRLPVVAITILLVLIFYRFSKSLGLEATHSMNNALILITSFYVFFSGRDNQWDMYAHSLMMVSVFFMIKLFLEDFKIVQNTLLSGLFMGLSILSKGPVSFYALFLPFIISYAFIYHIPFREKGIYFMSLILFGLAIGLSWYIYVRLKDPLAFKMIATRETTNWINYEVRPFYYYWSFFLQSGLWAIASLIALLYPYMKNRVVHIKAYRFSILWTILGLVFLSVIPEKKIRYLVPVLIPLALTTGFYVEYLIRNFNESMGKREKTVIYCAFGFFAFIALIYPVAMIYILRNDLVTYGLLIVISAVLMVFCAYLVIRGLTRHNFKVVFYTLIAIFGIAVVSLLPHYKVLVSNPYYSSIEKVQAIEHQLGIKTYGLTELSPEIVWHYGKAIPLIKDGRVPPDKSFGLIVALPDTVSFMDQFPGYQFRRVYQLNLHYYKKKGRLARNYYIASKKDIPL